MQGLLFMAMCCLLGPHRLCKGILFLVFLECEILPLKPVCLGSGGGVIFAFVRLVPGLQLSCTWGVFLDIWLSPKQSSIQTLLTAVTSLINSIDHARCARIDDSG